MGKDKSIEAGTSSSVFHASLLDAPAMHMVDLQRALVREPATRTDAAHRLKELGSLFASRGLGPFPMVHSTERRKSVAPCCVPVELAHWALLFTSWTPFRLSCHAAGILYEPENVNFQSTYP
jgi:hypothetical protein